MAASTTMSLPRPITAQMLLLVMCITFLMCFGTVHGKARFLSHIPYDEDRELPDNYEDDLSYDDIHDSITKLRGRHYPKLSYTPITGTHHLSRPFSHYPQITATDPRLRSTNPFSETSEMDGPRTLPLGVSPQEGSRGISTHRHPVKSPEFRYINERTPNSFREYPPEYPANPPPYSQNDEEHRQSEESSKGSVTAEEDLGSSPRFARTMNRNVTAKSGGTAELVCQVVNLQQQSVSWIRPTNLNILTVDTFRYSTDQRLSVQHRRLPHQAWVLRIRNVTELDSGLYDCQISTTPVLSYVVNLVVSAPGAPSDPDSGRGFPNTGSLTRAGIEEPRAEFSGGTALLVQRGSPISLECWVTHQSNRPVLVNWYHLDQILYPSVESLANEQTPKPAFSPLLIRNLSKDNKVLASHHPAVDKYTLDSSALSLADEKPGNTLPGNSTSHNYPVYYKQQPPHQQQTQQQQQHPQQSHQQQPHLQQLSQHQQPQQQQHYQEQPQHTHQQHYTPQQQHQHLQQHLYQQHHPYSKQQQQQHHQQQLERRKLASRSTRPDQSGFPDYPSDDSRRYARAADDKGVRSDAPTKPSDAETNTRFSLLVGLATDGRAGRYTCAPEGGKNATVLVHVVTGTDLSTQGLRGSSPRAAWSPLTALLAITIPLAPAQLVRLQLH